MFDEPSLGLAPLLVRGIFAIITTISRDSGADVGGLLLGVVLALIGAYIPSLADLRLALSLLLIALLLVLRPSGLFGRRQIRRV
jgi:branched-chain amino acid transport system permease protein